MLRTFKELKETMEQTANKMQDDMRAERKLQAEVSTKKFDT